MSTSYLLKIFVSSLFLDEAPLFLKSVKLDCFPRPLPFPLRLKSTPVDACISRCSSGSSHSAVVPATRKQQLFENSVYVAVLPRRNTMYLYFYLYYLMRTTFTIVSILKQYSVADSFILIDL